MRSQDVSMEMLSASKHQVRVSWPFVARSFTEHYAVVEYGIKGTNGARITKVTRFDVDLREAAFVRVAYSLLRTSIAA